MEKQPIILPESKRIQRRGWQDSLKRVQELSTDRESVDIWQDRFSLSVDTQGLPYFFILPISDVHIGHQGTDYARLSEYVSAIQKYPFYVVTIGDMGDFFNPKILAHAMKDDVLSVDDQMEMIMTFFGAIKEKTIGIIGGNHENFARNASGIDPYRWMAREVEAPLVNSGGILDLKVNDQEYKAKFAHKFSNVNSMFNRTHAGKQAARFHAEALDVVVSGDKHVGAAEKMTLGGRDLVVVQTGTFKTNDMWGKEMGFIDKATPFFPILAFDGRRHNVEAIVDLEAGIEFCETVKHLWKKKGATSIKERQEISGQVPLQ